MQYGFYSPKTACTKLDKVKKPVQDFVQSGPAFPSMSGSKELVAKAFRSEVIVDSEEDAADIRRQPFRLFPLSDIAPNGYKLFIEEGYFNNEPLYSGAPCSNVEFICVWASAYKVLGYLKRPSKEKTEEEILEERDTCLAFAYVYFNLPYAA